MIKYLLDTFEENPSELWASNMFGKSLNDLVKEQYKVSCILCQKK